MTITSFADFRRQAPQLMADIVAEVHGPIEQVLDPSITANAAGIVSVLWAAIGSEGYPEQTLGDVRRAEAQALWARLFRANRYTEHHEPAPRPTEPVRLYRGAHPDLMLSMAWTTDLAVADLYRDRHRAHASMFGQGYRCQVWTTEVHPDALLAMPRTATPFRPGDLPAGLADRLTLESDPAPPDPGWLLAANREVVVDVAYLDPDRIEAVR